MRALTHEEYDTLRDYKDWAANDPGREHAIEVSERLRIRGCLVRVSYPDGCFGYDRTPLGTLALSVSRPGLSVPT